MRDIIANMEKGIGPMTPMLALMSPAFWIAWIELIYSGELFFFGVEPTSLDIIVNYALSTSVMAFMIILYGSLPQFFADWLSKRGVIMLAGFFASCATIASTCGVPGSSLLTGLFTSVLAIRFGVLLSQVNPKAAMTSCIFAQIFASFMYGYTLMLPGYWGVVLLCLLPIFAAFFSLLDGGKLHYDVPSQVEKVSPGFVRLVLAVALFSIALNVVRGFYPSFIAMDVFSEARGNSSVLFFFTKAALVILILLLPTKTNLAKLCYFFFVGLAFLTLPLPVFGLGSETTLELFGCINALINLVIWTLLAGMAYKSGRSPVRLFGIGWGGMALGSVVGWLIGYGMYAGGLPAASMQAIEIVMIGVMLISCIFVVTWQVVDGLFVPIDSEVAVDEIDRSLGEARCVSSGSSAKMAEDESLMCGEEESVREKQSEDALDDSSECSDESQDGEVHLGRWKKAALNMACDYALSSRETDVLIILLKGYSKQRIAEDLFIAYNTVRAHVRNIYAKCDAHNQQELLALFERDYLA